MTTTEYSGLQIGGFVAPLTASTTNALLQDADPALFWITSYVQQMLITYLGARFDAEMTRAGLTANVGHIASTTVPFDPLPRLQQAGLDPPLLALFPVSDAFEERTRNWPHLMGTWKLLYILPPLTPAQTLQLYPLLRAIGKVIFDRLEQGHDPAWQSDANALTLGGIEQLRIEHAEYGSVPGLKSEIYFPALSMTLEVQERKVGAAAAQTALAGLDSTVNTTDADGSNPITILQTSQDLT